MLKTCACKCWRCIVVCSLCNSKLNNGSNLPWEVVRLLRCLCILPTGNWRPALADLHENGKEMSIFVKNVINKLFIVPRICLFTYRYVDTNCTVQLITVIYYETSGSYKTWFKRGCFLTETLTQNIQSARLSIQSSELGPPPPNPQVSVAPPFFGSKGRDTLAGVGVGGGPNSDKETDRNSGTGTLRVLKSSMSSQLLVGTHGYLWTTCNY